MKTRLGFVSNSSSSSFVIIDEPYTNEAKEAFERCEDKIEIKDSQIKSAIIAFLNKDLNPHSYEWSEAKSAISGNDHKLFLTRYISDGGDEYGDLGQDPNVYYYFDGAHCGPYDEDDFDEIADDVYIYKEHNKSKKFKCTVMCEYGPNPGDRIEKVIEYANELDLSKQIEAWHQSKEVQSAIERGELIEN